jgi:monoamine oxidase
MPHSPLAACLRRLASLTRRADLAGQPLAEVLERDDARRRSRRDFLAAGVAAGTTALAPEWLRRSDPGKSNQGAPRIVIIGGGLAGLTCAYRLREKGIRAELIEGNNRLGGRCATLRGAFAEGQIVERGGELIDTRHAQIRKLARELGLTLDDLKADEPAGTSTLGFIGGARYTWPEVSADFHAVYPTVQQDLRAMRTIDDAQPASRALAVDNMPVVEWINHHVPGGMGSRLGRLLDIACVTEFGLDSSEASAANLIWMLGGSPRDPLQIFGDSDERYHVRGGNDQLVTLMAAALGGQIWTGRHLEAIRRTAAGRYELSLADGSGHTTRTADRVVLALPFTTLHRMVDYSQAGFSRRKTTIISEYRLGTNAKHHLQFTRRHWRTQGSNGETFADTGYQNSWEVSRAQPGSAGILVDYTGGTVGAGSNQGSVIERSRRVLAQLEPVLPGSTTGWNGKAAREYWPGNPWSLGSYSCYTVGQYRRFGGAAAERSANCHFAGEHTSVESQGFLNGGVESGERAAREVLAEVPH